jgi:phage shock protein A
MSESTVSEVAIVGIIDRIKLNAKANLNYILDKAQDPQKMLNQFLLEMQGSVREVKEAVAAAIVGVKKLEHEISACAEKAAQWEERALLALRKGNDELARKALEQKCAYLEKERICKEELESQKQTVEELKESLSELGAKLDGLYQRRIELIKQYAQLQKRAAQMPSTRPVESQLDVDISVFDTYDRMVDKVRTLEAQAEALSELAETDQVEEEFRRLEREAEIEAELRAMKKEDPRYNTQDAS